MVLPEIHNAAVGGVESIAIGFRESVFGGKGGHSDIGVFVDHSRIDFMNVNCVGIAIIARLPRFRSDALVDVGLPSDQKNERF